MVDHLVLKGILSLDVIYILVASKLIDWLTPHNEGQRQCGKAFTIFVPVHHILQSAARRPSGLIGKLHIC